MPVVTTAELVERAMAAADMHDSFVTPRQWMYWASQERMALDLFLARSGWTQSFATLTITVTGSENGEFDLDTDMMAIVAVHEVNTHGVRRLKLADPATFLRVQPGGTQRGNAQEYRAKRVDDTLVLNFHPEPQTGETYLVTYVPHPNRLSLDATPATGYSNSVSYPMGWEERIVLGMARRALDKEESDSTPIQRQIVEMNQQIEQLCWDRAMADSPSIINSDIERRGWVDRLSYPGPYMWWWA